MYDENEQKRIHAYHSYQRSIPPSKAFILRERIQLVLFIFFLIGNIFWLIYFIIYFITK